MNFSMTYSQAHTANNKFSGSIKTNKPLFSGLGMYREIPYGLIHFR